MDDNYVMVISIFAIGFILFVVNTYCVKDKTLEYKSTYLCSALFSFIAIFLSHTASFFMIQMHLLDGGDTSAVNVVAFSCAVLQILSIVCVMKEIMNLQSLNTNENTTNREDFESWSFQQFWESRPYNKLPYCTTVIQDTKTFDVMDAPYPWAPYRIYGIHIDHQRLIQQGSCD